MLVAGDLGPPSQSRGGRLDRGKEVGFHVEGKISILFLNIFNGECGVEFHLLHPN